MEKRSYTARGRGAMFDLRAFESDGVTIRRAGEGDATALLRLAALDDAAPLQGDVIVAEVNGSIWAARSLADGRLIGDPFRPTAEAGALLELRAAHIARASGGRRFARRRRRGLPALG